jgi:hypothetical protein
MVLFTYFMLHLEPPINGCHDCRTLLALWQSFMSLHRRQVPNAARDWTSSPTVGSRIPQEHTPAPLAFSHDAVVSGLCEAQLNPFNCQNPYLSSSKVSTAIRLYQVLLA